VTRQARSDVTTSSYHFHVVSLTIESQRAATVQLAELAAAVDAVERLARQVDPGSLSGEAALSWVGTLARCERAVASGIARVTPVVVETGSFAKAGFATAADWLGAVSGSSSSAAKGRLVAADRAATSPVLAGALREGDLSAPQLKLITNTAAKAPEATSRLLSMVAEGASHQELSDEAARLRANARCRESARARRDKVNRMRHLRWFQLPDGGIRGEFLCDEVAFARVAPSLEAEAKERWKAAGPQRESLEAYRLDVFLDRLGSRDAGARGKGGRTHTLVLIDAEALRRGNARTGELCEIDGVGPVSVEAATELLGEGTVQFIVRTGVDIRTVSRTTRVLAQRIAMALIARDRVCVVPGCGKGVGLENDHFEVDFGHGGPTELANLARLCGPHHDMKTHGGWRLEGRAGNWRWVAPVDPPSAGRIARTRKVAVAKANRNRPRQT
jgi:hypothetical protein